MSTGLHYLDVGLVAALLAGVIWWMYALCAKPGARRQQALSPSKVARQPWDDDKPGGRGNR